MKREEMIKYLENPHKLNEYSLSELRALLRKYPYFQTAHMLFLLNLKNINDPRYREFLKQSAVYINDRDKFLRLVNQLYATPHEELKESPSAEARQEIQQEKKTPQSAQPSPEEDRKKKDQQKPAETKKDKDFSTEYLRNRISETLSEQKGDAEKQGKTSPELGSDFFIIDKVSQVEQKISRRLREEYQKEKQNASRKGSERKSKDEGPDSFELEKNEDNDAKPEAQSRKTLNFGGEYFSGEEYRKNREESKQKQNDLIEKFIKKAPELEGITPSDKENQDISKPSVVERDDLASEGLIKVYIKQGYYQKALDAYKKLSLKYPEKNDYFAEQIQKVKNLINEQQK